MQSVTLKFEVCDNVTNPVNILQLQPRDSCRKDPVEQSDDVVENVVVSPGVTSLIKICRATVQYMKGVLAVMTVWTTIGW